MKTFGKSKNFKKFKNSEFFQKKLKVKYLFKRFSSESKKAIFENQK